MLAIIGGGERGCWAARGRVWRRSIRLTLPVGASLSAGSSLYKLHTVTSFSALLASQARLQAIGRTDSTARLLGTLGKDRGEAKLRRRSLVKGLKLLVMGWL